MGRRDRNARLRRIGELDPEKDHREITAVFYLDLQAIMVLQAVTGNLMTFAVPRMSRILRACGFPEPSPRAKRISTMVMRRLGRTGPGPDLKPGERDVVGEMADSPYTGGWTVHTLGTHREDQGWRGRSPARQGSAPG
jgi:hypothetical protein